MDDSKALFLVTMCPTGFIGGKLMILGAHRSTAGGYFNAAISAGDLGCTALQIFTRPPSRWVSKAVTEDDAAKFKAACSENGIISVQAHDIYLTNLASLKEEIHQKSVFSFTDEIKRCDILGIPFLVTHCGAHGGEGDAAGIQKVADSLKKCIDDAGAEKVMVLLEGTAGQGDCLGWQFEHLAQMLEKTDRPSNTGVCLDTCHMFAAGYDISTEESFNDVFRRFDDIVGFERLKAMHCNDAKKPLGSRVDRHENIGKGMIGLEAFRTLMNDQRFAQVPIVLETPDLDKHAEDLSTLKGLIRT